jgi:hypothetical protein
MDKEVLKMPTEKKIDNNFVTVECLLAFDKDEGKERVLSTMRKFSSIGINRSWNAIPAVHF